MILGTCSTIEIIICLKKNQSTPIDLLSIPRLWGEKCQNVILSSTYQNAPGPSGHTNIKVGSEAAIVTLVLKGSDGIHNLLVYSIIQYYITIVITCIQYNYK